MDYTTGEIHNLSDEEYRRIGADIKARLVAVKRDLTAVEIANKQINLYSPCACGSGKKFKFCCHLKNEVVE